MNAFNGLVKKDMAVARFGYLAWLIMTLFIFLGSFPLSKYFDEKIVIVAIAFTIFVAHIMFLPITMLGTLRTEGKTQLWLHSPQSSTKLLLSKIVSSLIFQILSQCVVTVSCLIAVNLFNKHEVFSKFIELFGITEILLLNGVVLLVSLYISIWVIFYWTIYHSLSRYPMIKKFRWLVLLLIYIIYNAIEGSLIKVLTINEWLMKWTVEIKSGFSLRYSPTGWSAEFANAPFPVIPLILYALLAIVLFIISSRLLDRKVEV